MGKLKLTLACGDYEIVRALKEGVVSPDGIDLTILTDMDSTTRHWRFLRNREFDVAEVWWRAIRTCRWTRSPCSCIAASVMALPL
jgi:4,5-dihydroxyphthalate decarboxylase